jgi:hypothetical protein
VGSRNAVTGGGVPFRARLRSSRWLVAGLWLGACSQGSSRIGASEVGVRAPDQPASPPPRAFGQAGWERLHAGGVPGRDSPAAGEDAALACDAARHRVLLYGGKGDDDVNRNDLWSFDLETRRWTRIVTEGPVPPPCEDHTLVLDEADDQLVLFGGEDGLTSNATWVFDLRANRWTDITQDTAPALEGHVAVYDPQGRRMVVFGGWRVLDKKVKKKKSLEEATWTLDLHRGSPGYGTWSVLPASDPRPRPRREHRGVYDPVRHRLIIFGGRQHSSASFLNDVWALDLTSQSWREIETRGERPDPIRQMAFTYDSQANVATVFGGEVRVALDARDEDRFTVNQIWTLDLESGLWSDRTPYPRPMYDHVGLFVPDYRGTLVYGGSGDRPGKEHSTWLLRLR